MNAVIRRVRARLHGEEGFTLVELLVASFLFLLLTSIAFSTVLASARAARTSREVNDLNEEARLVLNRMSRELREARRITAAANPDGSKFNPASDVSVSFEVDFNGDNAIDPGAADPEVLTYRYDRAAQRLVVQASGETLPVLAGDVSEFKITYHSRRFEYNGTVAPAGVGCGPTNGVKDSLVTWQEVDAHPSMAHGNCNGALDKELDVVDSVTIDLRVLFGARQQVYRTRVDLRNRPA